MLDSALRRTQNVQIFLSLKLRSWSSQRLDNDKWSLLTRNWHFVNCSTVVVTVAKYFLKNWKSCCYDFLCVVHQSCKTESWNTARGSGRCKSNNGRVCGSCCCDSVDLPTQKCWVEYSIIEYCEVKIVGYFREMCLKQNVQSCWFHEQVF